MNKGIWPDALGIEPAMTFGDIGKELGVTRQRAEQIYRRAMAKLRTADRTLLRSLIADIESRRQYALPNGRRGPRENG